MRIGLCEKDLRGTLRENLAWMAGLGLAGFQIWKRKMDAESVAPAELLRMAGDAGLEVSAVGGGPNLVDPACARESVDLFRSFLDTAVELGAPIVTAESKAKPAGMADEDAWRSTVESVSAICRHAESVGAVLAVETSGPCFIRDCEMYLDLKERVESPALKVNYDPANIIWAGKDVVKGVHAVASDIVHTHAKDIARTVDGALDSAAERLMDVPAGEGLVGFEAYLRALRDIGYDGWLTIEMHAGEDGRTDDIVRAKENLERALADMR